MSIKTTSQVTSDHYLSASYNSPSRFASLSIQFALLRRVAPTDVLEVGIGQGVLTHLLRRTGCNVTCCDIAYDLRPDIVCSVTSLPFRDNSVDVVSCFEVLEHLPFSLFQQALEELRRVSRTWVALSLPDARPMIRAYIPPGRWFGPIALRAPFWIPKDHKFNGEHHWEVNKRGFELANVTRRIEASGLSIVDTWRPWACINHRFFLLKVQ